MILDSFNFTANKKKLKASIENGDSFVTSDGLNLDTISKIAASKIQSRTSQGSSGAAIAGGSGTAIMNRLKSASLKNYRLVQTGGADGYYGILAYQQGYSSDIGSKKNTHYPEGTPLLLDRTGQDTFGNYVISGGKPDGYELISSREGYIIETLEVDGDLEYPYEPPLYQIDHQGWNEYQGWGRRILGTTINPMDFTNKIKISQRVVYDPNYRTKPGERYQAHGGLRMFEQLDTYYGVYYWTYGPTDEPNPGTSHWLLNPNKAYNCILDDNGYKVNNPIEINWWVTESDRGADDINIGFFRKITFNTWQGRDVSDMQLATNWIYTSFPYEGSVVETSRGPYNIGRYQGD